MSVPCREERSSFQCPSSLRSPGAGGSCGPYVVGPCPLLCDRGALLGWGVPDFWRLVWARPAVSLWHIARCSPIYRSHHPQNASRAGRAQESLLSSFTKGLPVHPLSPQAGGAQSCCSRDGGGHTGTTSHITLSSLALPEDATVLACHHQHPGAPLGPEHLSGPGQALLHGDRPPKPAALRGYTGGSPTGGGGLQVPTGRVMYPQHCSQAGAIPRNGNKSEAGPPRPKPPKLPGWSLKHLPTASKGVGDSLAMCAGRGSFNRRYPHLAGQAPYTLG